MLSRLAAVLKSSGRLVSPMHLKMEEKTDTAAAKGRPRE